jgi:hypothetical protein
LARPPGDSKNTCSTSAGQQQCSEFGSKRDFLIVALVLLIVMFVGYSFCLANYFMADDTWQVQFAYRVLNGEWHLAFDNFTSSYLGVPSLDFYRPLLGFSYILDYAVWGMNAAGWYATNLICGYLSALIYYLAVRLLSHGFGTQRAFYCSLSASLLFVSYPLHVEDICWLSARADLLASLFYLPALIFFGTSWLRLCRSVPFKKHYCAGLVFYALSLLCKETGVTLPVVVACLPLLWSKVVPFPGWRKWLSFLAPFGLVLAPYLIVRGIALGSPIGGYTGDMGRVLQRFLVQRWLDVPTVYRLFVPLMTPVFGSDPVLPTIIVTFYAAIFCLGAWRMLFQRLPFSTFLFILVFLLQALAPIAALWYLDDNLQSGRIYYFFSMAFCLAISLISFAPKAAEHALAPKPKFLVTALNERIVNLVFVGLFALLTCCYTLVDFAVSSSWVEGSKQVVALRRKVLEILQSTDKKLILLGLPRELAAAHIVLMGFCFKEYFEPPFASGSAGSPQALSDRLLTFHCPLAGAEEPVNAARIRECVTSPDCQGPYFWSSQKRDFDSFNYSPFANFQGQSLPIKTLPSAEAMVLHPVPGQNAVRFRDWGDDLNAIGVAGVSEKGGLILTGLDLNPLDYDYLSFDIALPPEDKYYGISVFVDDKLQDEPFEGMGRPSVMQIVPMRAAKPSAKGSPASAQGFKWVHVRRRLSDSWHWFRQNHIRRLRMIFHNTDRFIIKNAAFESAVHQIPGVEVTNLVRRASGEYVLNLKGDPAAALEIKADASAISGAARMKLFMTKINEFFETSTPFEDPVDRSAPLPVIEGVKGKFVLPLNRFARTGYYELKVRTYDAADHFVGDSTDGTFIYRPSEKGPAGYYRAN